MTKILNVDGLESANEERIITLNGKQHVMKDVSVGDYLKINQLVKQFNESGDMSIEAQAEFLISTILVSFPTCSKQELIDLDFDKLSAISEFARNGTLPEGAKIEGEVDGKKAKPRHRAKK